MQIEALILRRCYPVPVTFADLRRARFLIENPFGCKPWCRCDLAVTAWTAALKEATGALDEVYAVVDGRDVRVAVAAPEKFAYCGTWDAVSAAQSRILDLLEKADRAGYWERPHEARLDLIERPVSHDEVARAVMVGQMHMESKAVRS